MNHNSPQTPHFAIAIDGPAASGKSTIARELAKRLGLVMVNSGAMYRAITWKVLQEQIDPTDEASVLSLMKRLEINCGHDGKESTITVDGIDPGPELRNQKINETVSAISAIPAVRDKLVALQRGYLAHTSLVMEGRDIGSVVFPDTPYKIYIDAHESVRNARRQMVGELDSVSKRDAADSKRLTAPLKVAEGAAVLDNSDHSIDSAVEAAIAILRHQGLSI